jgi:hypothetical protein
MKGNFKVFRMIIGKLNILSFKSEMQILFTEKEIAIDSCDPFAALPGIVVDLYEDVSQEKVALELTNLHSKINFLKDDLLAACSMDLYEVVAA